jgi:predicted Zn finger-like uncharacterized protein
VTRHKWTFGRDELAAIASLSRCSRFDTLTTTATEPPSDAAMPISTQCPQCQRSYTVTDAAAGRKFKCKDCGGVVQVPGEELESAPPGAAVTADEWRSSASERDDQLAGQKRHEQDDSGGELESSGAGKASLILGCVTWALAILAFVGFMAFGFAMQERLAQGQPEPEDIEEFGVAFLAGCGACGIGGLTSLIGAILGIVCLAQQNVSKTTGVIGLILNGLYFLLAAGFIVFSMIVGAANQP